ncbi:Trp biosynthesis-associated membrane protein [Frondihabitans cladoniiphilus]|uniref:Membrane protein (TIGR02234 family) n=1 Tax=Frondihabitans cladoniiphilus TaxID=715785 RepID=A0ABP8VPX0_9MICO
MSAAGAVTAGGTPQRTPRKVKTYLILAGLALSGLVLLAYTQSWVHTRVSSPQGGTLAVTAAGSAAAPALSALAFAGLALFGAMTIAGHVIRIVLGALEVLLGAGVVASALTVVTNPTGAARTAITKVTGVDGRESVRGIILSHSVTAWPWVALVFGLAMAFVGVVVLATSRRWPAGSRRYQAVRIIDPDAPTDPVVAWDTLTLGADPTAAAGSRDDDGDEDARGRSRA